MVVPNEKVSLRPLDPKKAEFGVELVWNSRSNLEGKGVCTVPDWMKRAGDKMI